MAVRTRRHGSGSAAVGVDHLVFVVPINRTAIIKHLTVHNAGAVTGLWAFYVQPVLGAAYAIEDFDAVGAGRVGSRGGLFHVLLELETLRLSGPAPVDWSASGALLAGDPT